MKIVKAMAKALSLLLLAAIYVFCYIIIYNEFGTNGAIIMVTILVIGVFIFLTVMFYEDNYEE